MNRLPRIAYDARLSLGQYRGMGRFLRLLIRGNEQEFIGLCVGGEQDSSLKLIAGGLSPYPLWEQISIPRQVRRLGLRVFLAPYNTAPLCLPRNVKLVLVVHDLIFMERLPPSRSLYQNAGRWYRQIVVPRAIRRADVVVTVSNHTARHLVSRLGVDRQRIRIIPNSIGEGWFTADRARAAVPRYVLVVAGEAPSKNLERTIAAFARCRQLSDDSGLRLKIAGVKTKFHATFQAEAGKAGVADSVDFLGYVEENEMRSIYRQASLFVMPSLSEGFGIPILEAMASGLPIAASSSTCLQEIGGDAARYFDPYSVEDMAAVMHDILADSTVQEEMSARGRVQSRKFRPDVIGEQIRSFWAEFETYVSAWSDPSL